MVDANIKKKNEPRPQATESPSCYESMFSVCQRANEKNALLQAVSARH